MANMEPVEVIPLGINKISQYDAILSFIIVLIGIIVLKIVNHRIRTLYLKKYGKIIPQIYMTLFTIFFLIALFCCIIVFIFEKSVFSVLAASGAIGIGLAFTLKELVMDIFSGIIMDVERRVHNGDWIKLEDGTIGKVIGHNWRSTVLKTKQNTVIVLPNSSFAKEKITNITSEGQFWETVEIVLDDNLPVKRMRRLLYSAVHRVQGVLETKIFTITASGDGITYECRYKLDSYEESKRLKHCVIDSIIETLNQAEIELTSLFNGSFSVMLTTPDEQNVSFAPSPTTTPIGLVAQTLQHMFSMQTNTPYHLHFKRHIPNPYTSDYLKDTLRKTPFIRELNNDELNHICQQANLLDLSSGHIICREGELGETMYIVLEGVVDIFVHNALQNEDIKVASLYNNDYFGDMALFLGLHRKATAIALSDVMLLEINRQTIIPILQNNPILFEKILKNITIHLEKNQKILSDVQNFNSEKPLIEIVKGLFHKLFQI